MRTSKIPRALGGVAVVAAAALALSACGTGGSSSSSTSGANATLTLADNGTTVVNFDPAAGSITGTPYLAPVYDTLIRRMSDGTFTPDLATSWQYTSPTEFTLTLRDDVKFADGTAMDAAAVVANLEHVKSGTGPLASNFASVSSVTATSPTVVTIDLSAPNPSLPTALSSVSGMIASPAAITAGSLSTTPSGSGPYTYDASSSVANSSYVYNKRADYWDASHYTYSKIVIKVITEAPSAVSAIQSGQVDITELGTASDIARAKAAGLEYTGASNNVWGLHLEDRGGTLVPALASVQVRQAMNYAIDRDAIVKSVQQGMGASTDQLVKPGMLGYDKTDNDAYAYNVDKAKSLMAAAGYAGGFSMDVVSLSLFDTQLQAIAGYLSAIGITLNVKDVSPDQYIPSILSAQYPAAMLPYGMVDAYYDYGQLVTPDGGFNPFHTSDDQINALYAQAGSATTDADRDAILQKIAARVIDQAWFLPVFDDAYGYVYKGVSGVVWSTYRPPMYYDWKPSA